MKLGLNELVIVNPGSPPPATSWFLGADGGLYRVCGTRVPGGDSRANDAALGETGEVPRFFLGDDGTLEENLALQTALGPDAAWLGMIPWGELVPVAGRPAFHNYAYGLLALTD